MGVVVLGVGGAVGRRADGAVADELVVEGIRGSSGGEGAAQSGSRESRGGGGGEEEGGEEAAGSNHLIWRKKGREERNLDCCRLICREISSLHTEKL